MSCTFWNMRRRQRAKLAEQTAKTFKANAVEDKTPTETVNNAAEEQETKEAVNDNADKRTGRKPKVRDTANRQ